MCSIRLVACGRLQLEDACSELKRLSGTSTIRHNAGFLSSEVSYSWCRTCLLKVDDEERSLNCASSPTFAHLRDCCLWGAGFVSVDKSDVREVSAGMWLQMLVGNLTKNVSEVH